MRRLAVGYLAAVRVVLWIGQVFFLFRKDLSGMGEAVRVITKGNFGKRMYKNRSVWCMDL